MVLFCEIFTGSRRRLIKEAYINDWDTMTSTKKGLKVVSRWLMCRGLLSQYSLAVNQLYDLRSAQTEAEDKNSAREA